MSKPMTHADRLPISHQICNAVIDGVAGAVPRQDVPEMMMIVLAELAGRFCFSTGPAYHDKIFASIREGAMEYLKSRLAHDKASKQ